MTTRGPDFTPAHDRELTARFDGSLARSASGGVKSWLGPMLERARDRAAPRGSGSGPPPFGVFEMRVKETRSSSPGGHGNVSLGDDLDRLLLGAVDRALASMPSRHAAVIAAHYQPEPPGCEGLEPRELRGVLVHTSGLPPARLKAEQARLLAKGVSAAEGLTVASRRLRAEQALDEARQAYAKARAETPHATDL